MIYNGNETDLIIADSINILNYKQKKLLLASENENIPDRQKYADALIKTLDDGVYNKVKALFGDGKYRKKVSDELNRRNVECVTYKSADYPQQLKHIPAPPLVLYVRGRKELLRSRMFGIVGSRRTPAAVLEKCKRFSAELSEKVTVVTGIADGGDSASVAGAIDTGNVICVLPGGHGACGLSDNTLNAKAEKNGLTVSEFAPSVPVQRHTFTLRNRLIAGLCEGVLVVSAGENSGALSTAAYAADYNKDVFAFPYGIGSVYGAGCNKLIKNGAYLCESIDDVFSVLGIECGGSVSEKTAAAEGDETEVLNYLKNNGETHAEKIAQSLNLKLTDVVTACSMLEIKGLIVRTGGNAFAAI